MRDSFRGADQLFRFGGEEFVVVLDHANEPGAQIAFDRLRGAIEAHPFPQVNRVTVSIGYTRIHPRDVPALCLERADAALYYAKSHGRNNIRHCEALIAAGEISGTFPHSGEVELF
jgi:diguanylate cyclase (GGDEF)-like protein